VFLNDVEDYQQAVQVFDEYTTSLRNDGTLYYVAATGNAAKVQVKGVEIDGAWSVTDSFSLTFAGAYNDAVYKEFKNSGQPPENGNLTAPYRDVSGQSLPGAAEYSFNLGGEFRTPVFSNKEFFTNFNGSYVSRNNSDVTLSSYGWIGDTTIVDLGFGIGRQDRSLEVGIIVKNLFDQDTHLAETWNTFIPGIPRWAGLQVNGKIR
jgi:outer membrane receptor protein involved in Fe transport